MSEACMLVSGGVWWLQSYDDHRAKVLILSRGPNSRTCVLVC